MPLPVSPKVYCWRFTLEVFLGRSPRLRVVCAERLRIRLSHFLAGVDLVSVL